MNIKRFKDIKIPKRAHDTDAGADIYLPEHLELQPNETKKISLGFGIELGKNMMAQIIPRSSLSKELYIANCPIDCGYTGEIFSIVKNISEKLVVYEKDDRFAQLVISKIEVPTFKEVDELKQTKRGSGGFGSTGKK